MNGRKLPDGWIEVSLASVADVVLGQSPPGSSYNVTGEGEPFFQGKAEFGDRFPSVTKWTTEGKKRVKAGAVLLSVRAPVGPTNVAPYECAIGRGLAGLEATGAIDPSYLLWVMRATASDLSALGTGSTFDAVSGDRVRAHLIPLAPLAEQKRIVAELERRISHVDQAIGGLRSAKQRVKDAKRSLLAHLTTDEWPAHWLKSTVEAAGESLLGLQRSPDRHAGSNMKPYLKVANVFDDRIDLTDVMEMHFTPEEEKRYRLIDQDILLNEGQSPEWLGRPAMWRNQINEMYFTNSLIRFRCGELVNPRWALLVFRSHMYSGRFQRESRITTNIAHLALGRLKTVEFPIPPIVEQVEIATEIERKLSLLEAADRAIDKSLANANQLRRALLAAAFSGKFVPQDLSDEPAQKLLEVIRAERASADEATKAAKKTTKRTATRKTSARKKVTTP